MQFPKLLALAAACIMISSQVGHAEFLVGPHHAGEHAEPRGELTPFGLTWVDLGSPGDCKVLVDARSNKPLLNPYSNDAYAVEGPGGCPETLAGGAKVVAFPKYVVRDHGVRFYAPWGRIFVFRRYPALEGWGHDQRFAFKWVSPEDF